MRFLPAAAITVFATAPLLAQELDPRFTAMGGMSVTIDGAAYEMVIPWDNERNRGYASEREIMGRRTFNLYGSVIREDGKPGMPSLQLTFFVKNGAPDLVSMEVYDEQGFKMPLTVDPGAGQGDFTEFEITDDNRISAAFAGEMVRMDNTDSANPKPAEDAGPVPIEGSVTVAPPG